MAHEVTAMDIKLLVATLPEGTKLAPWCRKLGISRQTAYKWRKRYREEGLAGLEDRSRAPKRPAGRTSAPMEDAVVAARKQLIEEGLDFGPFSVRCRLEAQGQEAPCESTIWRIGVRRGQVNPQPKKRPRFSYHRFQRDRPNECWQGDDTHYLLASGQEVRIINLLDDHSRLNVDSLAAIRCTSERVWESFCRASKRYGHPAEFLDDNGRPYTALKGHAPVVFQAHLARLGVHQIRSSPYHPQTCGKVERFHQTQRRWLDAQPVAATVAELQVLLDSFRRIYNEQRQHRALGRRTPAQVWAAQVPAAPAAMLAPTPVVVSAHTVANNGRVDVGSGLSIGLGMAWAYRHVTVIRNGSAATVIDTTTAEIARELTIDPTRRYQPRRPARPSAPRAEV